MYRDALPFFGAIPVLTWPARAETGGKAIRINQAMKLLWETELTVEETGLEAGFRSRKHFYDMFRRHTGMTPGRFRAERQRKTILQESCKMD